LSETKNRMTVLELLKSRLPHKYIVAIVSNMEDKSILDMDAFDIFEALQLAFDWNKSREGPEFWVEVFDALDFGDPLPDIPFKAKWKPNTFVSTDIGDFIINVDNSGKDVMVMYDYTQKVKSRNERLIKEKFFSFCN
jgi:hypothetical protein